LHVSGTAFVLKPKAGRNYKFRAIVNFLSRPTGGLVIDTQGNLYGKAGGFFRLSYGFGSHHNRWQLFDIEANCSGNCGTIIVGNLTYAGQSNGAPWDGVSPLYGVTEDGGKNAAGTVFSVIPNGSKWSETVLHSFCSRKKCADGKEPLGGPILDQAGNLYGTTEVGGDHNVGNDTGGAGVVFELTPGAPWTETVLHSFCSQSNCTDGAFPTGNLVQDASSNLLGVTTAGGRNCQRNQGFGCGVIYRLAPNGVSSQETVLHEFCAKERCRDGYAPQAGLVLDSFGNLFGTTFYGGGNDIDVNGVGGGTLFELTGSSYKVLHRFCALADCADGEYPSATPVADSLGAIFGTTVLGGEFSDGTLFKMTTQ
jgi:hypothetical protein